MDSPQLIDIKSLEEVHKEVTGIKLEKIIIPRVEQHEVQLLGPAPEFIAAVGMSRLWDARAAGREVAENTLKKLNGKKPDFFLLFTTIHYEKHGGFQEFLNGVWEVLPENTPLIGGTVAGFMNPEGCYTRGATALAVNYPNMDVAIGIGHNVKRTPYLAATECSQVIKKQIKESQYKNKFVVSVTSGPSVPSLPGVGTKRYFQSKFIGRVLTLGLKYSSLIYQKGFGREGEVLEYLGDFIGPISLVGTSSSDDNNLRANYSFYNKKVIKNCILSMLICSDLDYLSFGGHGFKPKSGEYTITKKSLWGYIISEIDGKPALDKFLEMTGWSKDTIVDEQFYRKMFFYPLGFKDSGGNYRPVTIGAIWGKSLVCGCRIATEKVTLLTNSGSGMLSVVEQILSNVPSNIGLGMFFSCAIRLEALGANVFKSHQLISDKFNGKPFLLTFGFGESFGSELTKPVNFNVSVQSLIINQSNKVEKW